jgi:hypothetical protein
MVAEAEPLPRALVERVSVGVAQLELDMFVQQHRVHCLVAHDVDFALSIANDQIGIYPFYFFSYQPELRDAVWIKLLLVAESDRLKREDCFARVVHQLDGFLEPGRGTGGSELAERVDQDWYGVGVCRCNPTNAADKTAIVDVQTSDVRADADNVVGRGDARAGSKS